MFTSTFELLHLAMADGRSVAKLNKPRRKKENPASSSSSSSSPLSLQCDVEIESINPGKHKTKPKLMGAPASAATKSRSGGRGGEDLIYVSPSRVSCSSFVCFTTPEEQTPHKMRCALFSYSPYEYCFGQSP